MLKKIRNTTSEIQKKKVMLNQIENNTSGNAPFLIFIFSPKWTEIFHPN